MQSSYSSSFSSILLARVIEELIDVIVNCLIVLPDGRVGVFLVDFFHCCIYHENSWQKEPLLINSRYFFMVKNRANVKGYQ